jgi:hypothetical protein
MRVVGPHDRDGLRVTQKDDESEEYRARCMDVDPRWALARP